MDESSKNELKRLSLTIVLDAYVTKNAIEDFLSRDWSDYRQQLLAKKKNPIKVDYKMNEYKDYLLEELKDINDFLNDEENFHWFILGYKREFFDKVLPKHKRKIEWFRRVDRYTFDYDIFFSPNSK